MADAFNKSEDLWSSYKHLKKVVWENLSGETLEIKHSELENTLRKHKQTFFSLLQNTPKNAKSREELKKGMADGIAIKGLGHQILSKELYQETLIISDMYDLNEFIALDLLCTAQIQMSFYSGLPRGLVAVLLYYDGRKSIVSTLRCLVQARAGIQWGLNLRPDVEKFITSYTDQLAEAGLFARIFHLLNTLDLTSELEKLQANLALGGPRHRRQVADMFRDVRVILAEVVFTWAAQCGLPKTPTVELLTHLQRAKLEEEASGKLDTVNLYLQMALLSALDLSVLHSREDGEEAVQNLPIIAESGYIAAILAEFNRPKWACEGLQAVSTFGLAVCLASLKLLPENQKFQDAIDKEEQLIDAAVEMNVFEFIHNTLLENSILFTEPFLYKRMHYLITDFIVNMYPKTRELRTKADEIARTVQLYTREGLDAPANLPHYFEYLLLTIGKLYARDTTLHTAYVASFWEQFDATPSTPYTAHRGSARGVSLFKFVRLAGDMLPPTLFVPYLTMLAGLASSQSAARHCFNMLKQIGPQLTSQLSWDHFFASLAQYYNNLRQEMPPCSDTVYRNAYLKGVAPQELEGLHAVLLLVRSVAEKDEFSRLALCEHPGWAPLTVLLGLVGCSVPIPLKAELLITLAALCKSAENAAQMWENLEASQVLVTVPTTSSYTPRGIQTELEEIESRMEEYPLTAAFLQLLDVLTDFGVPKNLGAGPRVPGFDPYLSFVVNSVFLKFAARAYRNGAEKWAIAKGCLALFEKFLGQYEPQASDFLRKEVNSPPGYHVMIQMNNKSEFLNVVLDVIDEGVKVFDGYVAVECQALLEECTLSCLRIVNLVLALQGKFDQALSAAGASVLLTHLNKLLLTINRRSGRPDHCVNIAKYISYTPYLQQHGLIAVKIINLITNAANLHNQFMNVFLSSDVKQEIRKGFVLSLDALIDDEEQDFARRTKMEILSLLKQCLAYNAPNLSHYLLGFDLKKDIAKTEFQHSGILEFPRSCLHSVISVMEMEVMRKTAASSGLLASAYHVIFLLASNEKTFGPVLRFLRLNKNFFRNHMGTCAKRLGQDIQAMNQMAWLMKTVAVEMKICGQRKQVSHLKYITNFLVNLPNIDISTNQDPFSSVYKEGTQNTNGNFLFLEKISNNFLINLIPHFRYEENVVDEPQWQFFDGKVLNALIEHCVQPNKLVDLKKLHQRLFDEVKTLQGTAVMGQIQAVSDEIPKVLKYALELNKNKEKYAALVHFVDAWCQIVEILTLCMPKEILTVKESQFVGICVVVKLLKKILQLFLLPEIGQLLSGAVLLIFENLRKLHAYENKQQKFCNIPLSTTILEMNIDSLKDMLENMIEWILLSNSTDEKLRINLYAALLTLLDLSNIDKSSVDSDLKVNSSMYVSRLDSSRAQVDEYKARFTLDSFPKFGEIFMDAMCKDCIGGYDVPKMLALSSFGTLIQLSGDHNWISYMSGRGYLKFIIQSVLDSNGDLQKLLEPGQTSMKHLYIYMSKISFLCQLARSRLGAELLLEHKLLACFGNMNVYTYHPEVSKIWRKEDIIESLVPATDELYLQLWLPTLELCNAILTTLGTENQSAVVQIMYFLLSHLDVVETILRGGSPSISVAFLKELALLTSIIARTANHNLINILECPESVQNTRAQLFRIQKLVLMMMPKFFLTVEIVKDLVNRPMEAPHTFQTSERLLYAMQVMSNLLAYARNIVANHDVEHGATGVLFQPSLRDSGLHLFDARGGSFSEKAPSLGVVVQQLINTVNHHQSEKLTWDNLVEKVGAVRDMEVGDIDELLEKEQIMQDVFVKREVVYDLLVDRLRKKNKEMDYCYFIIENAIYLIWVHLDYYMLKAIPKVRKFGAISMNTTLADNTLASASEATWKVSTDDISSLKDDLVSIFNDSFTKRLVESVQYRSDLDKRFVETMLEKINRLIQFVPVK